MINIDPNTLRDPTPGRIQGDLTVIEDLAVNGGDLTSTQTTFNLLNATVTTLNIGGAATAISIGAATGTLTLANPSVRFADGSAAAPSIAFAGDVDSGWYSIAANVVGLAVAGAANLEIASTYISIPGIIYLGGGGDTILLRDAANTLALRNGTNAQTMRFYETYTDASNYELFEIVMGSDTATLRTETVGTGADNLSITLTPSGTGVVNISSTLALGANNLTLTGTISATGARVTQSYHTNITSTNAVTVDSSLLSKVPESILDYAGDALAVIGGMRVVSYRHHDYLDASNRVKLGVIAETVNEPLALQEIENPNGGTYPGVNLMGLTALNSRGIQQLHERISRLEHALLATGIAPEMVQ